MQSTVAHIRDFISQTGQLAETKAEILTLKITRKASVTVADTAAKLSLAIIAFLVIGMTGVGAAYWLGNLLESTAAGFFAVAGFYVLIGIVLYVFRKYIIITPLRNYFIKKMTL